MLITSLARSRHAPPLHIQHFDEDLHLIFRVVNAQVLVNTLVARQAALFVITGNLLTPLLNLLDQGLHLGALCLGL